MDYDFPIVVEDYDRTNDIKIWETELHDFIVWYIVPDSDGGGKEAAALSDRSRVKVLPPVNTTTYTVAASDTLTSVAARFDTTPSELAELNRLNTRLVFPGQVLHVPVKGAAGDGSMDGGLSADLDHEQGAPRDEAELLDTLRAASPKPGRLERVATPPLATTAASDYAVHGDGDARSHATAARFLKINVRHITDGQGVVGGVLLVTPNAVMFDPNVSDPLVIEHGPESYGVIAPMEFVANAAIYHDIAHMRVGHSDTARIGGQKPEVYHAPRPRSPHHSPGKDSLLVKDETFPELAPDTEDTESVCSCRGGEAFPKAFERDLVTPTHGGSSSSLENRKEDEDDAGSSRQVSLDSCASGGAKGEDGPLVSGLEERRRSCLDQHWAIPSIDRSLDKDAESSEGSTSAAAVPEKADAGEAVRSGLLVKSSCHDSGIDIRDAGVGDQLPLLGAPLLEVVAAKTLGEDQDQEEEEEIVVSSKKVFSDADIIHASKSDWVPPLTAYGNNNSSLDSTGSNGEGHRKKTSSVSFSLDSNPDVADGKAIEGDEVQKGDDPDKLESRKNKMLKRLSYPLAWMEGLTGDKDEKDVLAGLPPPPSVDGQSHSSVFSKVFSSSPINLVELGTGLFLTKTPSEESSKSPGPGPPPPTPAPAPDAAEPAPGRSSVGTFIRQHETRPTPAKPAAPKLDYRSMVSVDDMPELFVSFDKLIPRPARSCEDPPLYLRLRMGKPINKKIPKSTPIMSYGKKKMRPEYWFSVPRNRVDDLYHFLTLWVPHLYGDLDEMDPQSRGFQLVESDTELWDDEGTNGDHREEGEDELGDLTRESWEVLSMSEELRRALYASSVASLDLDLFIPDLVGTTEVLSEEHRRQLCRHLPARAEGYVWTLVFSTSQHGFSLNSMYRKMNRLESPILMVIEDTEHNVFGALTSCAMKVSDHFYGTGESLLFRFTPEFQVFNWTGDNMYFIKGNNESLAIGAGDGKFGLWLDGDLYQGRTQPCNTYGNEPLAPQEDFVVKTLECWAFI